MIRLFVILGVVLWASGSMAATYPVRSANHDGFTRVVIDAPDGVTWTLTKAGARAMIALSDSSADFDLGSFFRRIDRSRIVNAESGPAPGTLSITLGCDCPIRDFRVGRNMIVLDFLDGPARTGPQAAAPVPALFGDDETRRFSEGDPPPGLAGSDKRIGLKPGQAERIALPLFIDESGVDPARGLNLAIDEASTKSQSSVELTVPSSDNIDTLSQAEQALLQQITRANSQGLVTARTTPPQTGANAPKPPEAKEPTHPARPDRSAPNVSLRALTTADEGSLAVMDSLRRSLGVDECLPDAMLDVNVWADPDLGFAAQIGDMRRRLSNGRDGVEPQAISDLARTYLYFGFGAEAAQALRLRRKMTEEDKVMAAMARIVDTGFDLQPGPLHGLEACNGHAALWASLAAPTLTPGSDLNQDAVLRSFTALPEHLRVNLGPILSRRLVAAGMAELATSVLKASTRLLDDPSDAMDMAEADLFMAAGETEKAVQTLEDVVAEDGALSPDALVKLIDQRFEMDAPVDMDLVQVAETLAKEHEEGDLAHPLREAVVRARIQAGQFARAFDEIASNRIPWPNESRRKIHSAALDRLSAKAGDADFLKNVMAIPQDQAMATEGKTGNTVARRLLDLGFAPQAEAFLTIGLDGAVGTERRMLRAKIALSDEKPQLIETFLEGIEGEAAGMLRAAALMQSEKFGAAQALYADLGRDDLAAEAAWLGGNWESARGDARSAISDAAALAERGQSPQLDVGEPEEIPGVLARNRALLESSEGMRQTISELLDSTALDGQPDLLN